MPLSIIPISQCDALPIILARASNNRWVSRLSPLSNGNRTISSSTSAPGTNAVIGIPTQINLKK
jgi:hypothetical protein